MRPAEMQTLDVTYPIGYFAGTSERGDYEKIQKSYEGVKQLGNTKRDV